LYTDASYRYAPSLDSAVTAVEKNCIGGCDVTGVLHAYVDVDWEEPEHRA